MLNLINLVNANLLKYIESIENIDLKNATEYALMPGGKRLRPLLLLSLLSDLNVDINKGIDVASGIEMIHTYSLVHDDLPSMDNDDFRRGKPTVHKQFGEALAILTGDSLLTDSFKFFSTKALDPEIGIRLVRLATLRAGSNGMIMGQVMDMNRNHIINLDEIKKIHIKKTENLISFAIISAGEIAKLSEEMMLKLEELSESFGLAFQIKDDIDDYLNGKDLLNDSPNYVKIIGIEQTKVLLNNYRTTVFEIIEKTCGQKLMYKLAKEVLS